MEGKLVEAEGGRSIDGFIGDGIPLGGPLGIIVLTGIDELATLALLGVLAGKEEFAELALLICWGLLKGGGFGLGAPFVIGAKLLEGGRGPAAKPGRGGPGGIERGLKL